MLSLFWNCQKYGVFVNSMVLDFAENVAGTSRGRSVSAEMVGSWCGVLGRVLVGRDDLGSD